MSSILKPSLNWLLVFIPIAAWLEHARPESHTAIFASACLAVLPLAGWLGRATSLSLDPVSCQLCCKEFRHLRKLIPHYVRLVVTVCCRVLLLLLVVVLFR